MKILFICHANICRSFMAQEFLNHLLNGKGFEVFSRGLFANSYSEVPSKVKNYLASFGVPSSPHTPTLLSAKDLKEADLVFVMEESQLDFLRDRYAEYTEKMFLLFDYAFGKEEDAADPFALSGRSFEKSAARILEAVKAIAAKVNAVK
ncbi:MAG: hypothetical protein LBM71_02890 [Elusimicrobiota bacterium]|jgi:protein-tyrosine phosphatase|nr:hypothetical protein [Elusimicrobiota bacterium]